MKSAKVVNKILLISLAFGSVSVVAGMFAGESLKKALIGVGATTSVASVAGILVTSSKKKSDENQEEKQLDNRVTELDSQEGILHQSVADQTDEMQIVETGVSSLPTEQNQLWDDPAVELNNEKQELETKYESEEQNICGLEDHKEDLEIKNDYLNSKFENLTVKNEILEQVIAPIEEQSFQETSLESETFNNELATAQNTVEEIEEITENITADVNPFANSADLSEFNQSEEISALEMADKLIGTFESTELDPSQDVPNEDSDELFMEDFDLEEEPDESAIAPELESNQELSFESESMDFEAMPVDDEADEPIAELLMEDEQSATKFSFDEQSESAIAQDEELGFSESESMDFEAMPMADDADEPIAELLMEDKQSAAEFSFDEQDESAIAQDEELGFSKSAEMDFEAMPMADDDADEPIAELLMEDEQSAAEFSFDDESAIAQDEELGFSESAEMDFEAMPMANDDADEPIAELLMEDEQSAAEFSFDEQDESAIAQDEELGFESESMDFEAMPMADDADEPIAELLMEDEQSAAEFSSDDESAIAQDEELGFESESMDFEAMPMADTADEPIADLPMEDEQSELAIANDEELGFSESAEMDFEAMPMADTTDEPIADLPMEDEQSAEFSFDEQSESAIAPELESNQELSFEFESMDFEAMPMADDADEPIAELPMEDEQSAAEFSFDEQDESAIAPELESESMDFEAMPMADDDEPIAELPMEDEQSAAEFRFDEQDESAIAQDEELGFESESMDFEAMPMADDADEPIAELPMEDEQSAAEFSFDEQSESAIAAELESNQELGFESESMDFEAMPMDDDEPIAELLMEDEQSAEFSFDEQDESAIAQDEELGFSESAEMDFEAMSITDADSDLDESAAEFGFDEQSDDMNFESISMDDADSGEQSAIASELESNQELSFDDESEISSESDDMDFEAMSMADAADDEPMAELVMEDESPAEFSFDEQSAMSLESEEIDFEAIPMADSDFDDFMGELVVDDQSAIATELESNQELSFDAQSEISSESDDMDFEAMLMVDDESDQSAVEFSFEDSSAIASKADEFMGQFIDEDDSAEEMSSESDEFSFNVVESLNLDAEASNVSETDEFMKELVDDNELAFNELTFESEEDVAIADNYDSDEFMAAFSDADESPQEFSFEETSTDDSKFNELLGAFSDDSQSSDDELNADSDAFNVKFEDDEENYDLDELDSLDAIDKKLDELTEISDDSLGELNDLLGSIQDNTSVKEEELNEINREK